MNLFQKQKFLHITLSCLILFILFMARNQGVSALGYDLGLRYGPSLSSRGQDPFMESFQDRITFTNVMLSNELVLHDAVRLELGLLLDERAYQMNRGNRTTYRLYFVETPLVLKLYPVRFLYMGAGVGYAYNYKVNKYKSFSATSAMFGVENFVDDKTQDHEANFVLVLGGVWKISERIGLNAEFRHNYSITNMNKHNQKTLLLPKQNFYERFRSLYFLIGASFRVI